MCLPNSFEDGCRGGKLAAMQKTRRAPRSLLLFLLPAVGCATLPKADRDLFIAAQADDPREVDRAIRQGADVNVRRRDGWTPLHSALERLAEAPASVTPPAEEVAKTASVVQLLLARGAR